jgi:hypothetical protein
MLTKFTISFSPLGCCQPLARANTGTLLVKVPGLPQSNWAGLNSWPQLMASMYVSAAKNVVVKGKFDVNRTWSMLRQVAKWSSVFHSLKCRLVDYKQA